MPYAVIFPGQGAAAPGAGEPWVDHQAWSVVDQAEALLDRPLARLLLEADADELATTRASQLAVLLTSLVAWDALAPRARRGRRSAFAGHSLGQITALFAAGAVDRSDGLPARRPPGRPVPGSRPTPTPGAWPPWSAPTSTSPQRLCDAVDDVWVANDNAPGQVVVAGTPAGPRRRRRAGPQRRRPPGHAARRRPRLPHARCWPTPPRACARCSTTLTFREPPAPVVANTDAPRRTPTRPAGPTS